MGKGDFTPTPSSPKAPLEASYAVAVSKIIESYKCIYYIDMIHSYLDCEGGVLVDEHNPYDSQRSSVSSNYPQNTITASSPYSQNTIDRHSNSLNRNQSPNATLNRNHPSQGFRLTNQSPILMRRSTNQSPTSLSQRLSNHSSRNSGGSDDHLTIGKSLIMT